jgi:hypothetical protein
MPITFPDEISGFEFRPIEFDKKARLIDSGQIERLRGAVSTSGVTDLMVVSHGWNNDEKEALGLYRDLLRNVAGEERGRFGGHRIVVAGIFWPSKKFAESEVIPGGAASLIGDVPESELIAEIEKLRGFFDSPSSDQILDELAGLVDDLETEPSAQRRFGELAKQLLGDDWTSDDEVSEEMPSALRTMPGDELIDQLSAPREEETMDSGRGEGGIAALDDNGALGGDEGGAAFLGSLFSGVRSGARNALNLFTYYQMKDRAGVVGSTGVGPLLRSLRDELPHVRIHLAGHSFGGRLVTAAVSGDRTDKPLPAHSLTLLQAAFSHNGFAKDYEPGKDGFFRRVVSESPGLPGPVVVTHTSRDLPNRWAYPMASRLARHKSAVFGGADDLYGAIGSNGAQRTPEAEFAELLGSDGVYHFAPGRIHNLDSSAFISGHNDVRGPQVANAVVAAMIAAD